MNWGEGGGGQLYEVKTLLTASPHPPRQTHPFWGPLEGWALKNRDFFGPRNWHPLPPHLLIPTQLQHSSCMLFWAQMELASLIAISGPKKVSIFKVITSRAVLTTETLHCKKRLAIFPSPARMSPTNSPGPGITKLFPARESLVNDIPAGYGKIYNLFL